MVGVRDAKNLAVRKELKERLCIAKPMEVVVTINTSVAPRAQKAALTIALPTEAAIVAVTMVASEPQGENPACAFGMEVARGAKERTALRALRGFFGLCISHGGGRRCQFPSCTKGEQGSTMFCKAHDGGKRCNVLGCTKGAEGGTPFCKGHGGGKRCSFQGGGICSKSVHGGTQFCLAHGGGKSFAFLDCIEGARGRTDYCVRHGGGKRCKSDGCGKSAQRSTDFCKAHGGGKRCSWGQPGSDYSGSCPCDRFVRGKVSLCGVHDAFVEDSCIHGGGTLRPPTSRPQSVPIKTDLIKEDVISLRTRSCVGSVSFISENTAKLFHISANTPRPTLPEGRAHGGNLMVMLSCRPDAGRPSSSRELVVNSDRSRPYSVLHERV